MFSRGPRLNIRPVTSHRPAGVRSLHPGLRDPDCTWSGLEGDRRSARNPLYYNPRAVPHIAWLFSGSSTPGPDQRGGSSSSSSSSSNSSTSSQQGSGPDERVYCHLGRHERCYRTAKHTNESSMGKAADHNNCCPTAEKDKRQYTGGGSATRSAKHS
ncbi:hypothetical protein E2C01_069617 [Portunus trituberculatus]|uniref:Uncharacterized protein n=1 Tax=Portunus trituberculatus TaxID=210409 RepID=A0A5B7I3A5_PORTR|nr:hypothetical protein [Portunus trituberculatus]